MILYTKVKFRSMICDLVITVFFFSINDISWALQESDFAYVQYKPHSGKKPSQTVIGKSIRLFILIILMYTALYPS